ncbi:hypothetical protein [Streptomyces sp. NPDC060194]|uniref:hypothetical protein n=1 Tax=Streptomyces sp. NPDC060194 TaxID=3347069 RepID=UPI00364ADA7B
MTEFGAGPGMGMRGRNGIVSLVDACLHQPPTAERPVTVLLGPRGSGASEAHNALMERFGPDYPFAYVNFGVEQTLLPRYALGLIARQLERKLPRYRRSRFPLLTLGLLASDQDLRITDLASGRRDIRRGLDAFRTHYENRYGDVLGAFLDVAGSALGAPAGASAAVHALLDDAVRRGRRRMPGGGRFSANAAWYGAHPLVPSRDRWEALVELNLWRHGGRADDEERLDRVLFSAFLADLRRGAAHSFSPRSHLLLLDNTHSHYGRSFLDLLLRARHEDTVIRGAPCDPLTVVASSNRWLPRWGPATGEQWSWRLRLPDRAGLADWHEHRPPRDGDDSWWYPLRLRDLNLDEVRLRMETQARLHPDLAPFVRLAPFVHRLTCGLPRAVQQVLEMLRRPDAPTGQGPAQERWLRSLPGLAVPGGEDSATLAEAALAHLLDGFDARERERLAECAAAQDLSVGTRVLDHGEFLFTEIRARRLLDDPGTLTPVLHPWLRRLLLWQLARSPGDWNAAHELLGDHFAAEGRKVPEMYHRLAAGRLDLVAGYLHERFLRAPVDEWIGEYDRITSAPNRLLPVGGPLEMLAGLAPPGRDESVTAASVVRELVAARWLWSDPLADPAMRLNTILADGFIQLSRLRRTDTVALLNASERYSAWRHPLTWTGGV